MGDKKMTRDVADWLYRYRWWPWVMMLLLLPGQLWPASWWMTVDSVYFSDTHAGEVVPMTLGRTINRPFDADWTVTIRKWDGGWTVDCVAAGSQPYKPDSVLPKSLTLNWWTWGKCHPLPVGKYEVTAVWRLKTDWPFADKRIEITSNVFEVR